MHSRPKKKQTITQGFSNGQRNKNKTRNLISRLFFLLSITIRDDYYGKLIKLVRSQFITLCPAVHLLSPRHHFWSFHSFNPIRRYIAAKFITKITLNQRIINNCSVYSNSQIQSCIQRTVFITREEREMTLGNMNKKNTWHLHLSRLSTSFDRRKETTKFHSFKHTLSAQHLQHYRTNRLIKMFCNLFRKCHI